jgi:hypothetical protein
LVVMRLLRSALPLFLLVALTQCQGTLPPYETVPPPLSKAQQKEGGTQPTRVAVCYNAMTTTAAEVRALAARSCEAGTAPKPIARDLTLTNCPMLQPARATFACAPP